MNAKEMLEKVGDSLGSAATVRSVFGEPIHVEGKTIVPVARVAYGFGAGYGSGRHNRSADATGEGGGGGGGMRAVPAGALEITANRTRFIHFTDKRRLMAAVAAGVFIGRLLFRRRLKN
jgi:uncharacterized spore protein YtfJ